MPITATACLSPQQMRMLCDVPTPDTLIGLRDRAFLATLASSGCSVGEAISLTRAQIFDSPDIYIDLPQGKLLTARRAPLSSEAHERLAAWLTQRPIDSAYLFTRFNGRGLTARASAEPMSRTSAWRLVQRYAEQVGLAHVKPHDFRRFAGTELVRQQGIHQAQRALGHKRIETTAQHYLFDERESDLTNGLN